MSNEWMSILIYEPMFLLPRLPPHHVSLLALPLPFTQAHYLIVDE
jgi:hypothetical protein